MEYYILASSDQHCSKHLDSEIVLLDSIESQKLIDGSSAGEKRIFTTFMERFGNSNETINKTTVSSYKDVSHSMIRNGEKFVDWNLPIYSQETKQLVDPMEIRTNIKNHYIVDRSKKLPFICQIDHECSKHFTNYQNAENHIFSYFYFIVCPNCGKYYKLLHRLNRHIKKCKEKTQSGAIISKVKRQENYSVILNSSESERSSIDVLDDSTFPAYSCINGYRVYSDEIKERVKNNYSVDYAIKLPFICKLDHNCSKCFTSSWHVENHIFSTFFFIQCPNCGKIFNFLYNVHKHLKICTEKPKTVDESLKWDQSSKDKVNDADESKPKQGKSGLIYDSLIHPVYSWDTKEKVTPDSMRSMVKSSFIKYKNNKMPFICKLDHNCPKSFAEKKDVELHVFGHFFFTPCPNCKVIFKDYLLMTQHLETCNELLICEDSRSDLTIGSPFLERKNDFDKENCSGMDDNVTSSNEKFDLWIYPVYNSASHSRVFPNEIKAKIRGNYNIDGRQTQSYICQVDHKCHKTFTSVKNVEDHLFCHLFYTLCPNCGKIFKNFEKLNQHLLKCKSNNVKATKRPVNTFNEMEPNFKKAKNFINST